MTTATTFETRLRRFSAVRRGLLNAALGYRLGAVAFGAGAAGLLLLSGRLPGAILNAALYVLLALGLLGLLIAGLVRYTRFRSVLDEAFKVEELQGGLKSRLISAWDFQQQSLDSPLATAVIDRAARDLELPFEAKLDRAPRDRRRKQFIVMLVIFLALGLTPWFGFTRFAANARATWIAVEDLLFPVAFELQPAAGRHIVKVGEKVDVSFRFLRRGFPQVTLLEQRGDRPASRQLMNPDAQGRFRHTAQADVEGEIAIRFAFGDRQTDPVVVIFASPPTLVNMQTELIYPAYTRMLPRTLEGVQSRLLGLAGTRITVGFTFSKELESAVITWDDGETLPLDVVGRFASISLLHSRERRASLQVKDVHGFGLDYPVSVDFELQSDEPPQIALPKHLVDDMPLLPAAVPTFGFGVRAQDDFGVIRCVLKWQKTTVDNPTKILDRGEVERQIVPAQRKATITFEKIFAGMAFAPGDKIIFQVEAADNRTPDTQITRSRPASFFIYREELDMLSIHDLGFGVGEGFGQARIAKSRRATSVKEPEGLRTREKVWNDFEATVTTDTHAPSVRGEHVQATRDYFRLLSTATYEAPGKKTETEEKDKQE